MVLPSSQRVTFTRSLNSSTLNQVKVQRSDSGDISCCQRIYLCIQVVVVDVAALWHPSLNGSVSGFDIDLVLCSYLLGVFSVASFKDHPASAAVRLLHSTGDHVLVLVAINQHQVHSVCLAGSRKLTRADLYQLRKLKEELEAEIAAEGDTSLLDNTYVAFFDGR